jgi:hypothetical protein
MTKAKKEAAGAPRVAKLVRVVRVVRDTRTKAAPAGLQSDVHAALLRHAAGVSSLGACITPPRSSSTYVPTRTTCMRACVRAYFVDYLLLAHAPARELLQHCSARRSSQRA